MISNRRMPTLLVRVPVQLWKATLELTCSVCGAVQDQDVVVALLPHLGRRALSVNELHSVFRRPKNHSSGRERGGKSASVRQVRLRKQMTATSGSGRLVRPSSEDSI